MSHTIQTLSIALEVDVKGEKEQRSKCCFKRCLDLEWRLKLKIMMFNLWSSILYILIDAIEMTEFVKVKDALKWILKGVTYLNVI